MIRQARRRNAGQGMTEYIIIVALVAIAAIGVYSAFGDIVRGQASVAAVALSGEDNTAGRSLVGADAPPGAQLKCRSLFVCCCR